jgi:hypothetical protein
MPKQIDITNIRFGKLVAIKPVGKNFRGIKWLCQCDCGKIRIVNTAVLRNGEITRCNICSNRSRYTNRHTYHGYSKSAEYKIWQGMHNRCRNPKAINYERYGGRGITVAPQWSNFVNFINDVGPRPHPSFLLDRINNNKGYFPDNVRWADPNTSSKNKRTLRNELSQFSNTELLTELRKRLTS